MQNGGVPVKAVRYATPLREGGSLPAIVEGDDGRLWVAKFRGAGQGTAALVAELVAGTLGQSLGLPIPALDILTLDATFGRTEQDSEIRHLLAASAGSNVGVAYLGGAIGFDPAAGRAPAGDLASAIVAFDAFIMNVDRTPRNPNLLWWQDELWLIDHGAAMYWHHDWASGTTGADRPFAQIRDHVLLPYADRIEASGAALIRRLDDDTLRAAVARVPDDWLTAPTEASSPEARRNGYVEYLAARRDAAAVFLEEAVRARAGLV